MKRTMDPFVRRAAIALGVITLALFLPATGHEFVHTDDDLYVTAQPMAQQGLRVESIVWAFTNVSAANWQPITWLSHMLDCQLYGLQPRGHHFTSVLLHSANAVILFLLLWRLTGSRWRSAIVAALFAWHPLRVESVAWVSERKDVLSCLFFLLALWRYHAYVQNRSAARYLQALALFACSLMSKATMVTMPFVLLLLDYWPLKRIGLMAPGNSAPEFAGRASVSVRRALVEKVPFLAVALAVAAATVWAQGQAHQVQTLEAAPLALRLANAVNSYCAYLGQTFIPFRLALFYPMPESYSAFWIAVCVIGLLAVTIAAFYGARRHPHFLTGWLWFLGVLVPMIGLVQVSVQARADRYTYIPHIGLFIALVWGAAECRRALPRSPRILGLGLCLVAAGMIWLTTLQIRHWSDSESLYRQSIRATDGNEWAHNALGIVLFDQGRLDESKAQFMQASRLDPTDPGALYNLAIICEQQNDLRGAAFYFEKVLEVSPERADMRIKYGIALNRLNRKSEALVQFATAARGAPDFSPARRHYADSLSDNGQFEKAVDEYAAALKLSPPSAELYANLAAALNALTRHEEAADSAERAVKLDGDFPDARFQFALALSGLGRAEESAMQLRATLLQARAQGRSRLAKRVEERIRAQSGSPPAP